jgi:hypothetical protein
MFCNTWSAGSTRCISSVDCVLMNIDCRRMTLPNNNSFEHQPKYGSEKVRKKVSAESVPDCVAWLVEHADVAPPQQLLLRGGRSASVNIPSGFPNYDKDVIERRTFYQWCVHRVPHHVISILYRYVSMMRRWCKLYYVCKAMKWWSDVL